MWVWTLISHPKYYRNFPSILRQVSCHKNKPSTAVRLILLKNHFHCYHHSLMTFRRKAKGFSWSLDSGQKLTPGLLFLSYLPLIPKIGLLKVPRKHTPSISALTASSHIRSSTFPIWMRFSIWMWVFQGPSLTGSPHCPGQQWVSTPFKILWLKSCVSLLS